MNTPSFKIMDRFIFSFLLLFGILLMGLLQVPSNSFAEPVNYALHFDGVDDNVQLPLIWNIFGGDSWRNAKTISLWIKPEGPGEPCGQPNPGHCQLIIGVIPRSWGISRGILNGLDRIWVWNIDDTSDYPDAVIPLIYEPDEWIHITLVHANDSLKAYRYGSHLAGDTRPSGSSFTVDTNDKRVTYLIVGGFFKETEQYGFKGDIDEIRIYSQPPNDNEISKIYQELAPPFNSNLKAYYRMSDGNGMILTDDSNQDHSGIFREGLQTAVPPGGPQWGESGLFGSGPTPTLPPIFTITATFTNTPSPTATATRLPPGFTPRPSITPSRTLDPSMNNFLFLPLVRR